MLGPRTLVVGGTPLLRVLAWQRDRPLLGVSPATAMKHAAGATYARKPDARQRKATMSETAAEAAIVLIERAGCCWRHEEAQPGHTRIEFARRPGCSNSVVLEISRDEAFHLLIDDYLLTEFNYDDGPRSPELAAQVQRGLDYLNGRCLEQQQRKGDTVVSRQLIFPDGSEARLWLPPWQRLWARISGTARLVRSSSHP